MSNFVCNGCQNAQEGCIACRPMYYVMLPSGIWALRQIKCKYEPCNNAKCGYGHGTTVFIEGIEVWRSNIKSEKPVLKPALKVSSKPFSPTVVVSGKEAALPLKWLPAKSVPAMKVLSYLSKPSAELRNFAFDTDLTFKSEPKGKMSLAADSILETGSWIMENGNDPEKTKELLKLIKQSMQTP